MSCNDLSVSKLKVGLDIVKEKIVKHKGRQYARPFKIRHVTIKIDVKI